MKATPGNLLRIALPLLAACILLTALDEQHILHAIAMMLAVGGSVYLWMRKYRSDTRLEARFRLYFEHAMIGMACTSVDKRWLQVNPALCKILGYTAEELVGKTWEELTYPDDLPANNAAFEQTLSGEIDGYELEKRFIRADGKIINTFIAARAVRKDDGSVDHFVLMLEDTTARVTAEAALRASEEQLRALGDNLPESFIYQCTKFDDGRIRFLYVSSGVQHIYGVSPAALMRDPLLILNSVAPEQRADFIDAERRCLSELHDFSMELNIRLSSGKWGWLQVHSRPRLLASGEVVWDGIATNVTARRQTELQLAQQARRAGLLLDLPHQAAQKGETEFIRHASQCIEQITGSRHCSLLTLPIEPTAPLPDWAQLAVTQGQPVFQETDMHAACVPVLEEGEVCLLAMVEGKTSTFSSTDQESIQLLASETWRILRRQRAEKALKIATQVVNASPVVCFRWQASDGWPVVFASENVARWGYRVEDLLAGQPQFADIVHPDDLARVTDEVVTNVANGLQEYIQEYRLLTAEKQVIWVVDRTKVQRAADGTPLYFDGVLTDITDRKHQDDELTTNLAAQRQLNKRLEEAHNQLLQSEKMASIGQLAAGIAHELNNPIGFVHSNLGTLESYLRDVMEIVDTYDKGLREVASEDAPVRRAIAKLRDDRDFAFLREDISQLLGESKDGLARVRKIVLDLKSFSHVSEQEWQWADLQQGLDSTLNIVWNELKYKCKVIKEYEEIPRVYCLISQLNQVFMNLLVNAGHAIETQGTITIRTRREGRDAVCIEIADTGKGIPPEHLGRIFEPFFTTKPVGKGTGLGLSLAYGIVDKHHGRIDVESTVGAGTTFRVIIPVASAEMNATQPSQEPSA